MKKLLVLVFALSSLNATQIDMESKRLQKLDDSRKAQREILSMDVDIREFRRSAITQQRESNSIVVSKMIQLKDKTRG